MKNVNKNTENPQIIQSTDVIIILRGAKWKGESFSQHVYMHLLLIDKGFYEAETSFL